MFVTVAFYLSIVLPKSLRAVVRKDQINKIKCLRTLKFIHFILIMILIPYKVFEGRWYLVYFPLT